MEPCVQRVLACGSMSVNVQLGASTGLASNQSEMY